MVQSDLGYAVMRKAKKKNSFMSDRTTKKGGC